MNSKILAIIAVVIVVVAGAGAAIVMMNGDSGSQKYVSKDDTGRLTVFGNSNNDDYLNNDDVTFLEKIIKVNSDDDSTNDIDWEKDYPLADADNNDKVDSADVTFVKNILNGTQHSVYVLQTYNKVSSIEECKYPLTSVGVAGYETITVLKTIGAVDKIKILAGASGDSFDATFYSDVYDLPKCGKDIWNIDPEQIPKDVTLDAIIAMDSKSYIPNYADFENANVDVVRIEAANAMYSLNGIVTLGFLLGCEEKANEAMEFFDGILNNIKAKVATVADKDKVTGLFVTMTNYVEGVSSMSEYTGTMEIAGAVALADQDDSAWGTTKARLQFKTGEEWLLKDKYQADYIVHSRALGLKALTTEEMQTQWDTYSQYFTKMNAYPDGYFILNSTLSPTLRIAFMAEQFYPDLFEDGYAQKCVEQYYEKFITNIKDPETASKATWIITSDMVTPKASA